MTDIAHDVATETGGGAELSRSLKSRHVSMIAIGGIIGAGLFVGSSTTISQAGPAAVFSFAIAGFIILLVMRMISEMVKPERCASWRKASIVESGKKKLYRFISSWRFWRT